MRFSSAVDFSKSRRARVRDERPIIETGVHIHLWECIHGSSLRLFSQWNWEKLPDTSRILGNPASCRNIRAAAFECGRMCCTGVVSGTTYLTALSSLVLGEIGVGVLKSHRESRRRKSDSLTRVRQTRAVKESREPLISKAILSHLRRYEFSERIQSMRESSPREEKKFRNWITCEMNEQIILYLENKYCN